MAGPMHNAENENLIKSLWQSVAKKSPNDSISL